MSDRVYTSQLVRIGQRWRSRKTQLVYAIVQIHRKDRQVELRLAGDATSRVFSVAFADLRRRYELEP